jgi:acyl-coenzyme A thioesterase PaaI-like protein
VFGPYLIGCEEHVAPVRLSARCFGCGPEHPTGLRIRCFRSAGGILAPIVIDDVYDGPPRIAHGGIVAACLDEVLAAAVCQAAGRVALTGELTIRYLKPTPTKVPLLGRARVVSDHAKYVEAEGHLEALGSPQPLATARGRFFPIPQGG